MLALKPIEIFQSVHKDVAAGHAALVRTSALNLALSFTLAEMSARHATSEELVGARIFAGIFLNLAENPELPKPELPSKDLGMGARLKWMQGPSK